MRLFSKEEKQKKPPHSTFKAVCTTLDWVTTAFVLTLVFIVFEMQAYTIPTGSMADTLMGAHFRDASASGGAVTVPFGTGCGLMAAVLGDLETDVPGVVIGATDIAMRQHLPPDLLAFTVNLPMYKQLCELGENSFLGKSFWQRLKNSRKEKYQMEL